MAKAKPLRPHGSSLSLPLWAVPEAQLLQLRALVPVAWLMENHLSFRCDAKVILLLENSGP